MVAERLVSGSAQLSVSVWGDRGPTVLALHPGIADSRIWQWCAPTLVDAGFRVVAYDRRGFGQTTAEAEAYDDLADLRMVTGATGARPAVIVGNSLGGGLALDLALTFPDDVDAMVLIAPSPTGYDYGDWPTAPAEAELDSLVAAAEASGDLELVNRLEVRYWLDGVEQPEGRVGGAPRELLLEMNGIVLRAGPVGEPAARPPAWSRLADIRVPVLVMVGEYDLPGIRRQCSEIADAIPMGRIMTIAQSAHLPALDRPDALSASVLDFIESSIGHGRR